MVLKKIKRRAILLSLTLALSAAPIVSYGADASGWKRENESFYYQYDSGKLATGMSKINGLTYFMNDQGVMQTGWIWHENNWYFAMPSGELTSGWLILDGKWYYMRANGVMVTKGWRTIDNVKYYMDEKGAVCVNQYVGKNYVDKNGVYTPQYDIEKQKAEKNKKVRTPSNDEYLNAAEAMNTLPKVILNYIITNNWSVICVTDSDNMGTVKIADQEFVYNMVFDSSAKQVKVTGVDNVMISGLEFFEKLNNISIKYSSRLKATMDLSMETSIDMDLNSGNYLDVLRLYWIQNTAQYLNPLTREDLKRDNQALYNLIEEIVKEYGI